MVLFDAGRARAPEGVSVCAERLRTLLLGKGVVHQTLCYGAGFTAEEAGQAALPPGWEVARTVLLRDRGGELLLVVVPAPCSLDSERLTLATGRVDLGPVPERERREAVPDSDPGAMPPFGVLYDLPTYVDACFNRASQIVFPTGDHRQLIAMRFQDYVQLAHPVIGQLCFHRALGALDAASGTRRA